MCSIFDTNGCSRRERSCFFAIDMTAGNRTPELISNSALRAASKPIREKDRRKDTICWVIHISDLVCPPVRFPWMTRALTCYHLTRLTNGYYLRCWIIIIEILKNTVNNSWASNHFCMSLRSSASESSLSRDVFTRVPYLFYKCWSHPIIVDADRLHIILRAY